MFLMPNTYFEVIFTTLLQVLRAIIHNEIVRIDPEVKENQPLKYHRQVQTNAELTCVHSSITFAQSITDLQLSLLRLRILSSGWGAILQLR